MKAGRQGVNLDNQRYVGTVGWRQNMQTLDAAALTLNPVDDLQVYYGFVWQANPVFGSEASHSMSRFSPRVRSSRAKTGNLM